MMFLPEDKWSPRYDKQFYTIRMKKYVTLTTSSEVTSNNAGDPFANSNNDVHCSLVFGICNNGGKKERLPAVYYQIEVLNGTSQHVCLRRYSHFQQLCKKLNVAFAKSADNSDYKKELPPKTLPFFHKDTEEFLEERMAGLYAFLNGLLIRQECVGNSLIRQFLDIDCDE